MANRLSREKTAAAFALVVAHHTPDLLVVEGDSLRWWVHHNAVTLGGQVRRSGLF